VQEKNSEYHKTGAKGGAKSVQLTENQIPRHSHGVDLRTNTIGQHSHPYVDVLFPVDNSLTGWPDLGHGAHDASIAHWQIFKICYKRCYNLGIWCSCAPDSEHLTSDHPTTQ